MADAPLPYELLDPDRFGDLPTPAGPPAAAAVVSDAAATASGMKATWEWIQADWRRAHHA